MNNTVNEILRDALRDMEREWALSDDEMDPRPGADDEVYPPTEPPTERK